IARIWSSMVFLLSKKPLWTAKVLSIVNRPDGSLADHWSQLGLVMFFVLMISGRGFRVPRRDLLKLIGLGVLANALYQSLFITGMAHTRTGNAALIVSTTPFFSALIGRMRRQEYFTARGVTGLALAFGGILLIIVYGDARLEFGSTILGDLILVGSTLCWTVYTFAARNMVHTHGSLKATAIMMMSGTPVFLIICAPSLMKQNWSEVRPQAWAGVGYSALFAIALAHLLWNYGVRRLGSTRTAIYSNFTPVTAMLIVWAARGEAPTAGQIAGAAIIFIGLYLVRHGMIAVAPAQHVAEEIEEEELSPGKN
ncbi:MAG: DMT family transporter, partial [Acidobacteriota bacterium]